MGWVWRVASFKRYCNITTSPPPSSSVSQPSVSLSHLADLPSITQSLSASPSLSQPHPSFRRPASRNLSQPHPYASSLYRLAHPFTSLKQASASTQSHQASSQIPSSFNPSIQPRPSLNLASPQPQTSLTQSQLILSQILIQPHSLFTKASVTDPHRTGVTNCRRPALFRSYRLCETRIVPELQTL